MSEQWKAKSDPNEQTTTHLRKKTHQQKGRSDVFAERRYM